MPRALPAALVLAALMPVLPCGGEESAPHRDTDGSASDALRYEIAVRVVDQDGMPVEGAEVGAISIDQMMVETRTDDAGRGLLEVALDGPLETIWAVKPGVGLDYLVIVGEDTEEEESDEPEQKEGEQAEGGESQRLPPGLRGLQQPLEFVLNGVRDISVNVVDAETGQPLPGSVVVPWYVYKAGKAAEFNVSGLPGFMREADEQGNAKPDVVPIDNAVDTPLLVRSRGYVAHESFAVPPGAEPVEITARLVRLVKLSGRVLEADGSPAAGATVLAAGDGYHYGYFRTSAETGGDGTFQMEVSPEEYYSLVAQKDDAVSEVSNLVVRKGEPMAGLEITLQRGTRVYGRVTAGPEQQPLANLALRLCQQPAEEYPTVSPEARLPNPKGSRDYIQPLLERRTHTDESGAFQFFVGPGRYYLVGPLSAAVPRFTITDQEEVEVDLVAHEVEE